MTNIESLAPAESTTLNTLKNGIERTAVGAHGVIRNAADAAHPAVDQMAASSHVAVDKASGLVSHAADAVGLKGEELRNAQARLTASAGKYVHDHPLIVLGLAAAVGFTASRYLSRS